MKTNPVIPVQRMIKQTRLSNHWIQKQTYFSRFAEDYQARSLWIEDFPESEAGAISGRESEIAASVALFQLGESSEGRTLKQQAFRRVMDTGDWDYLETLDLFIKEEQQHAGWLGRWMDTIGFPRLTSHPSDHFFRKVRHLLGLELSLITLSTAEIIAVPYYRAVMRATNDPFLKAVCRKILKDEARHLRFQQAAITHFMGKQPLLFRWLAGVYASVALEAAVFLVYRGHRPVWKVSGMTWLKLRYRTRSIAGHYHMISLFSK